MNQRYYSLDIFRGATVALMILVNNPGTWSHIYGPLKHAPWHGCTPTDLVFPFFLFAVGNAMAFVMPGLEAAGNTVFLKKVFKRAFLIFTIGLLLNWSPFVQWQEGRLVFKSLENLRLFGVLQRIAVCYLFASIIIYYFKIRGAFFIGAVILLAYWMLTWLLGDQADPYSLEGFWGTGLDRTILGEKHMYKGEGVAFDPEGIASSIPAIVQVIFGFLAGQYIRLKGKTYEMIASLFVAGALLTFAGWCWDLIFPINKKLWTSSYVVFTTGLAITVLSVLVFMIEFRNYKGAITRFFEVFGRNPLFIFVLSGFLPRVLALIRIEDHLAADGEKVYTSPFGWFYKYVCMPVSDDLKNGSLLYAVSMILMYWLVVYWLDRRKIYIKV